MDQDIEIRILKQQIRDLKNKLFEIDMLIDVRGSNSKQYISNLEKEIARLNAENQNLTKLLGEIAG